MKYLHKIKRNKIGYTLLELLAVLVILASLAIIVIPIFTNKSETAKQVSHNENLRILQRQAQAYLLSLDTIQDSPDIIDDMIASGYLKERPKNPIYPSDPMKQYKVTVSAATKIATVYPSEIVRISDLNAGSIIMFHGEAWKLITPSTGLIVKSVSVANMNFDPNGTQLFNPSDNNNIGYYLNNTYFNTFTPEEKLLIKNSDWHIGNETNETASILQANVGLLTNSEYISGKAAGLFPSGGDGTEWWLITPLSVFPAYVYFVQSNGINGCIGSNSGNYGVRPAIKIIETIPVTEVSAGVYSIVGF